MEQKLAPEPGPKPRLKPRLKPKPRSKHGPISRLISEPRIGLGMKKGHVPDMSKYCKGMYKTQTRTFYKKGKTSKVKVSILRTTNVQKKLNPRHAVGNTASSTHNI